MSALIYRTPQTTTILVMAFSNLKAQIGTSLISLSLSTIFPISSISSLQFHDARHMLVPFWGISQNMLVFWMQGAGGVVGFLF
jgi:hypothetical protein